MKKTLISFLALCGIVLAQQTGSITDERDGNVYKTVKIGGRTWMAENLRYKSTGSTCLEGKKENCSLGRFYSIENYLKYQEELCPEGFRLPALPEVVCVLQKNNDDCVTIVEGGENLAFAAHRYDTTATEVGTLLKSKELWKEADGVPQGSDALGFSAIPLGHFNSVVDNGFGDFGGGAYFWTATSDRGGLMIRSPSFHMLVGEADPSSAYYWGFYNDSDAMIVNTTKKSTFCNIRCIKDE